MARSQSSARITIRLTAEQERRLKTGMEQRGYGTASALVREALLHELGQREQGDHDRESRIVAALEQLHRDNASIVRAQKAALAVLETFVKTFLTCIPEPPQDGMTQSIARARDRYTQFIKSAGQALAGNGQDALSDLLNDAD